MKNKKIFIITLIIIAILILAVATVSILYFNTDILKTNEQLFTKYLFQGNDTIKAVIDEVYEDQEQFKKDNSYLAEGNLKVTMQNGNDPKEEFNITTNTKHDIATNRTLTEAIVKDGETDLAKFSYLNSEDVYAILCENVYQNYVGIRNKDLKQLAEKFRIRRNNNRKNSR